MASYRRHRTRTRVGIRLRRYDRYARVAGRQPHSICRGSDQSDRPNNPRPDSGRLRFARVWLPPCRVTSPFLDKQNFAKWPEVRKLEAAYHFAEAKAAGAGNDLLSDVLMLIAKKNAAIIADPAFVQVHGAISAEGIRTFTPRHHQFAEPTSSSVKVRLPELAENIVKSVVERSPENTRRDEGSDFCLLWHLRRRAIRKDAHCEQPGRGDSLGCSGRRATARACGETG